MKKMRSLFLVILWCVLFILVQSNFEFQGILNTFPQYFTGHLGNTIDGNLNQIGLVRVSLFGAGITGNSISAGWCVDAGMNLGELFSKYFIFYAYEDDLTKMVSVLLTMENTNYISTQFSRTDGAGYFPGDQTSNCDLVNAAFLSRSSVPLAICQNCAGYGVSNMYLSFYEMCYPNTFVESTHCQYGKYYGYIWVSCAYMYTNLQKICSSSVASTWGIQNGGSSCSITTGNYGCTFSNAIDSRTNNYLCCQPWYLGPTRRPTFRPTISPSTIQPSISVVPSLTPSLVPSIVPSVVPSVAPSIIPSLVPSVVPSQFPSVLPSINPTFSMMPTIEPTTVAPTQVPTVMPTTITPSCIPSIGPTSAPSPIYASVPLLESQVGSSYIGSEARENFIVSMRHSIDISGGGGGDKYTFMPVDIDITITINDFNSGIQLNTHMRSTSAFIIRDYIDISNFPQVKKFEDVTIEIKSGFVCITFAGSLLKVQLDGVFMSQITSSCFIFGASTDGDGSEVGNGSKGNSIGLWDWLEIFISVCGAIGLFVGVVTYSNTCINNAMQDLNDQTKWSDGVVKTICIILLTPLQFISQNCMSIILYITVNKSYDQVATTTPNNTTSNSTTVVTTSTAGTRI